jgi:hypothetical protein
MPVSDPHKVTTVPARLFVILAREAPIGVILRRGPSKWVELILWHTDTDYFEHGQWFKGRIYERACHLSPDGTKFLYFGSKYHLQKWDASTQQYDRTIMHEWTAISRPPYYTALALWPNVNENEAWGGFFLDNSTLFLQGKTKAPVQGRLPKRWKVIQATENTEKYRRKRLLLDGWNIEQERIWQFPPGKCVQPEVQRKRNTIGSTVGRYSIVLETDFYSHHYSIEEETSKEVISFSDTTWMDFDHQGRLVFTSQGKLFASPADELNPRVVADFNSDEPTEVIAPDWARKW